MSATRRHFTKTFAAADMGADVISPITDVRSYDDVGYLAVFTSAHTPVGLLSVQGSMDYDPTVAGSTGTWVDIVTPVALTAGSPQLFDIVGTSVPFVRFKYTRTSGGSADTLTVTVTGKGS